MLNKTLESGAMTEEGLCTLQSMKKKKPSLQPIAAVTITVL